MVPLQTDSGSGANIATGATVGAWTHATERYLLRPQLLLTNLNAAAATIAVRVRNVSDGCDVWSTAVAKSTDTSVAVVLPSIMTPAGKTYSLVVTSTNTSDTNASWAVDWLDVLAAGITAEDVWGAGTRALTDKTGFALTSDYDAAKTAMQAGDERLPIRVAPGGNAKAAIEAAAAGSVVMLAAGTFAVESVTVPEGVTVIGAGVRSTTLTGTSAAELVTLSAGSQVRGMSILNTGAGNALLMLGETAAEGVYCQGHDDAIFIVGWLGVGRVNLVNVRTLAAGDSIVVVNGDVVLRDCVIETEAAGAVGEGSSALDVRGGRVMAVGCIIQAGNDQTTDPDQRNGVRVDGDADVLLSGCTVSGPVADVRMMSGSARASGCVLHTVSGDGLTIVPPAGVAKSVELPAIDAQRRVTTANPAVTKSVQVSVTTLRAN